jgi:hypothetical protein
MKTECIQEEFQFQGLGSRKVVSKFDGGAMTSDAGALLLRETEAFSGVIRQFAACFTDYREPDFIEHTVEQLLAQRVYALALGYEDLNDHDKLRFDQMLAVAVGKADPTGEDRKLKRDKGKPLAGKSTLNRLELTKAQLDPTNRYQKIVARNDQVERFFIDIFLQSYDRVPDRIVLDVDATDDPLHGDQMGKFFHGYYSHYCYLPLYIFCGDHLLCACLRESNIDGASGAVAHLERIVTQIRECWPAVEIVIRGDSGFCREEIMAWCEAKENRVDYILGLAKNSRLKEILAEALQEAAALYEETGEASRVFEDFTYQTLKSWSRERRVIGKAEHLSKGSNPRFVVTSLSPEEVDARTLYEKEYCARGDMENRIKEQQLDLFADRTSTHWMRSNQLRLWLSSVAYTLVNQLRHVGLKGTGMARAQCGTIREKLFKIGAHVMVSVRRVKVAMASGCPYQGIFSVICRNLQAAQSTRTMIPLRC